MIPKQLALQTHTRKNREAIENYLCCDEEDRQLLELTTKQQDLLTRWNFADNLLSRDRFTHHDIVDQLRRKFGISETSAWDDLREAQIVFGSANALNKRYISYAQIRRLEVNIRLCLQAQNWKAVADLEKVLQKALDALPDTKEPQSARTIIFNIQQNNAFSFTDKELEQALNDTTQFLDHTPDGENQLIG